MRTLVTLAMALVLASCGGGDEGKAVDQLQAAAAAQQRKRIQAVPTGADPVLNANRLLDYGEAQYHELFPTHETTRTLEGWVYRYYPQTGTYLAVINWRVFVVGGPLGPDVRDVGEVSSYITITSPTNQTPTVGLSLATGQVAGSIVLTATAADTDGTIAKVEFFDGATKLGETTTSPYTYTWLNVASGLHQVTATATDNSGASASTSTSLFTSGGGVTPTGTLTVAALAKCSTALGTSEVNAYKCVVGSTPVGTQTADSTKSCSMAITDAGVITVSTDGQTYAVDVTQLPADQRHFTKTDTGVSFDYGPTAAGSTGLRIKARTEDKVLGQFFQQGGSLFIEVKRSSPALDLSCSIPLAMS